MRAALFVFPLALESLFHLLLDLRLLQTRICFVATLLNHLCIKIRCSSNIV